MARQGDPVKLPIRQGGEDYSQYLDRLSRFADEKYGARTIRFQVADGYARYFVDPSMQLHLIAIEDGYTAHPALIRGLLREEIQEMLDWEARWGRRRANRKAAGNV